MIELREEIGRLQELVAKQQEEIAGHKAQNEYLERLHGMDYLTGVHNRKAFDEELDLLLSMVRGEHEEQRGDGESIKGIALIFVDIDHFKEVNDTRGHSFGDEVLKKVSATLDGLARDTDFVARVGGEEFAVLLRSADERSAALVAEKLRSAIEELAFDDIDAPDFKVTASFGIASSVDSVDPKGLYSSADSALYQAKAGGRNRVEVYRGA